MANVLAGRLTSCSALSVWLVYADAVVLSAHQFVAVVVVDDGDDAGVKDRE